MAGVALQPAKSTFVILTGNKLMFNYVSNEFGASFLTLDHRQTMSTVYGKKKKNCT